MTLPLDGLEPTTGQWRLAEVQLANWGTFDGAIYRFPIAREGHLVTGPSGSGKSSLLDAIAAVLTPDKWLRLNQAAQGAGSRTDQRSLVSYVRGAWSRTVDEAEDRVVSQFLRPRATWSGILLRYENDNDRPVTLGRLFFLRAGGSTASDIHDLCLLDRSVIDLRDLEPFTRAGIETRKVQAAWPDALVTSNRSHARFYARLRSIFGIADETALQLLHKTQSAKNLDSLDDLFREYMLEEPPTFALADNAAAQFGELRDAHDRVVQLRLQRDHLVGVREAAATHDRAMSDATRAKELALAVAPYQKVRGLSLARQETESLDEQLVRLDDLAEQARARYRAAEEAHGRAERAALELGGAEPEHLQREIRTARDQAADTQERWHTLARQLGAAGIDSPPRSSSEFAELIRAIEQLLGEEVTPDGSAYAQQQEFFTARNERDRLAEAIRSVRATGSTVPGRLLRVRAAVADHLGLPVSALPFAAELIEVTPEHAGWTGAIERVLRPLSLAMLVRTEHLAAVRRWVEGHDLDRTRLVFEEVREDAPPPRPAASAESLVNRVAVAAGPFAEWLGGQLSERFDYACVPSPDQLERHSRAVTINGQVKTSRTRYEKDDRTRIGDRGTWVLGDRDSKIEALVLQLADAEKRLVRATKVVEELEERKRRSAERLGVLKGVREQRWGSLDVDAATNRVAELERLLHDLTQDDSDLTAAVEAETVARRERERAHQDLGAAELELSQARRDRDELRRVVATLELSLRDEPELADDVATELDRRFRSLRRHLDRPAIAELGQPVTQRLRDESDGARRIAQDAAEMIVRLATGFNEQWPAAAVAADLSPSVDDRHGYLELLDQILANGLPEHEASFLRLLRERSRDMVGELVSDILAAPREIAERIVPVNESLRRSPFDADRYLRLRVKTRHTDTVNRFIADLRSVSGGWTDDDLDSAEKRFAILAELMRQLASSLPGDRLWRRQCLDTRLHVTFLAEEVDEHGTAHATYDSGAAMSGGQQQKLVVFCLAAALRYQLADADDPYPRYGTIVLDEAFDKADTRYTRMALDIFVEFGFQLVLATPQKLLQTIEPYVGAATSIENPTRRRSEVASVQWSRRGDAS